MVLLTPLEKENALVTLLDPTAVPGDEVMEVTEAVAESSDQSLTSGVLTDESEPPETEEEAEELPIITHEIETIHFDETGELVKDYISTPSAPPKFETDAPYISPSANLVSEEDLVPVMEDSSYPSLDIVVTPTTQIFLTTAAPTEEPPSVGLRITTLSGVTGQPPTEAIINLQEDEDVNTLPDDEEAADPAYVSETEGHIVSELETAVELLEPEGELELEPEEELLEVLQPTPEQIQVPVPVDGSMEVVEPEPGITEMTESEGGTDQVLEPEEEAAEVPEVSESVGAADISEPEAEVSEVSEPEGVVGEVSEPEEEVGEAPEPEDVLEVLEEAEVREAEIKGAEVEEPVEENQESIVVPEPEETETQLDEVSELVEASEPKESKTEMERISSAEETVKEDSLEEEVTVLKPEGDIVHVAEEEPIEGIFEVLHPGPEPEKDDEVLEQVEEESELGRNVDDVATELEEGMTPSEVEGTAAEVADTPELGSEVVQEEAGEPVKPAKEEVTLFTEPEKVTEGPEEEVMKVSEVAEVVESPSPGEGVVGVSETPTEPELEPEPESHATEVMETEDGAAGSEEEAEATNPTEDLVAVVKPEEEGAQSPEPEEHLSDVSEPGLIPEAGEEAVDVLEEEHFDSAEEESEPGQVDSVDPTTEELPEVTEPTSEDEVAVDLPEPAVEEFHVPAPNPEDDTSEISEPEPKGSVTEPPAESIKILQPLDGREHPQFEDQFVQPEEPGIQQPPEEDNLPVIPTDIQPPEGVGELHFEHPVPDNFYLEEDVVSVDAEVEKDSGAIVTESSESVMQFEPTSDVTGEERA